MDNNIIIETIKKTKNDLFLQKFLNEIEDITDKDRISKLQDITYLHGIKKKTSIQQNMFADVEEHMFKKPWKRLPDVHKIMKIKEFLDNNITGETEKKKLFKTIKKKYIKEGPTLSKCIKYDNKNGTITNITCIVYNKKKQKYSLKLKSVEK